MKLLVVNKFYYLRGGSERYIFELNKILGRNGISVIPFSMADEKNIPTEYSKYFLSKLDFQKKLSIPDRLKSILRILYSFESRGKILELINKTNPDLAHIHNIAHQISPSILPLLKKQGIPILQTLHDFKLVCPSYLFYRNGESCEECKDGKFYKATVNRCIKNSFSGSLLITAEMYFHKVIKIYDNIDIFITPSLFMKKKLEEFGMDPKKLINIPNFVLTQAFSPNYDFQDYFIYFGRLQEEKGVWTLLKAMEKTWKVKLIIVGEGILRKDLESYVKKKGLNNVIFKGYKSGEELKNLVRNAMFTIIPSECYENCPISVLEAFAMGKPVIGAKIGGIPELINVGVDGLLFEPGNEMDLRDKILNLLNNPIKVREMGRIGREKAENIYNIEQHFEKIYGIYKKLIKCLN